VIAHQRKNCGADHGTIAHLSCQLFQHGALYENRETLQK
jgi:hypothetical protein